MTTNNRALGIKLTQGNDIEGLSVTRTVRDSERCMITYIFSTSKPQIL